MKESREILDPRIVHSITEETHMLRVHVRFDIPLMMFNNEFKYNDPVCQNG